LKIAIIGAGPTGLSSALHLQRNSQTVQVDVYEASDVVGGYSKSFPLFDQIVDLGPHRFYTQDKDIMNFWLELAQNECHTIHRKTSIYYNEKFIKYPIAMTDLLFSLPFVKKLKIFSSFLKRKKHNASNGDNFASTMRCRFGDELYELFFKKYTEKVWGVADTELSASVAYQRIGNFGLSQAIMHALQKVVRKVEDKFSYPTNGCGQIWESAAQEILRRKGRVFLSSPVSSMDQAEDGRLALQSNGKMEIYDKVISTIPVSRLLSIYKKSPPNLIEQAQHLQFRSTVLIYVEVFGESPFSEQWVYINSDEIQTGRITNFSNWGMVANDAKNSHILCLEYWCDVGDAFWATTDEALYDIAKEDLIAFGVHSEYIERQFVVRLPRTYPIITQKAEAALKEIATYFENQQDLQTIGRGGAFKYNNQDHCIEMGIRAAKKILGEDTDVWGVNTSYEYIEKALVDGGVPPG
jgi:protoporphyrinogen oxidase